MAKPSLSTIIGKIEDARTSAEEGSAARTLEAKEAKLAEIAETLTEVIGEVEKLIEQDE